MLSSSKKDPPSHSILTAVPLKQATGAISSPDHLALALSSSSTLLPPAPPNPTRSGHVYERNTVTERYELLLPKRTSLRHRLPEADDGLLDFINCLLCIDPHKRPSAAQALQHPWLEHEYVSLESN